MQLYFPIYNLIIYGFAATTVLLLIARLLPVRFQKDVNDLSILSNVFLLIGSVHFLATFLVEFLTQLNSTDGYEKFSYVNRLSGPYMALFWVGVIFKGVLPQVLWSKKRRKSLQTSAILLPFLLVDLYIEKIMLLFPQYLPSSWRMSGEPVFMWIVIPSLVYMLTLFAVHLATRYVKGLNVKT